MKKLKKKIRESLLLLMAMVLTLGMGFPIQTSRAATGEKLVMSATPFLLSGQTTTESYKLMWNHVDTAQNYRLYRNGREIYFGTANVWSDYDVKSDAEYRLEALDAEEEIIAESECFASPKTVTDDMRLFSYEESPQIKTESVPIKGSNGHTYRYWTYTNGHGAIQMEEQDVDTGDVRIVADQNMFPELAEGRTESVKVIQAADGTVTLWAHAEGKSGYTKAAVVSIYGQPGGDFETKGPYRPLDNESRDISIYADKTTGEGYLLSATNGNKDLAIYKLNENFTDIDESFGCVTVLEGKRREAPCLVKKDGWYYLFSSAANGWKPSACGYISAQSIQGLKDAELMFYGNSVTYGAQSGDVKIWGTETKSYVMGANRWSNQWDPKEPEEERCGRFIPLNIKDGIVTGTSWAEFYYNEEGTIIPVSPGKNLSVGRKVTSSTAEGEHLAELAVDGVSDVAASYFKSVDQPLVLTVELDSPSVITLTDVVFRNVGGSDGGHSFKVYGSTDNANWNVLADNTQNPLIQIGEKANFITDETPYKYIKLEVDSVTNTVNKNSAWWANGIVEFSVYGYSEDELKEPATSGEETKPQETTTADLETKPQHTTGADSDTKPEETTRQTDSQAKTTSASYKGKVFSVKSIRYKITACTKKNKTVMVTGAKKSKKTVRIPSKIKYKKQSFKVTAIGKGAFKNHKKLSVLYLGRNVKNIGKNAFYNCRNLKKITINSKVIKKVGRNAFRNVNKKVKVKASPKIKKKLKVVRIS